jgi:hypothetical protein
LPTVLEANGFWIIVLLPPREHGPAHVHVTKAGFEVVITLDPVRVRSVDGMRSTDVVRAVALVEDHRQFLLNEWRKRRGEATES